MSPIRRVWIDGGPSQEEQAEIVGPWELLRKDDVLLDDETYQTAERTRLLAEDLEAERSWAFECGQRENTEPMRERDLAPVEPVPRERRPPTEAQRRLQATWADVPREVTPSWSDLAEDGHEMAPWTRADDLRSDEAARWLRENDPEHEIRLARAELKNEISRRLWFALVYMNLRVSDPFEISDAQVADIARSAFAAGRPTAERRNTRRAVREALGDLYADGSRHDLLAAELGCSRQALHTLMAKP